MYDLKKKKQKQLQEKMLDLDDPSLALGKHRLQLALLGFGNSVRFWAFLYFSHSKTDALGKSGLGEVRHLHHGALDLGKWRHRSAAVAVGGRRAEAAFQQGAQALLGAS